MIDGEWNLMYTMDIKKELKNMRGKHIKSLLSQLEKLDVLDIVVRKVVLDAMNDYSRDVLKVLGYDEETSK